VAGSFAVGDRARLYFDEAARLGGGVGVMRLAALAQITSTEARGAEDTAELIARLDKAGKIVREEIIAQRRKESRSPTPSEPEGVIDAPKDETPTERLLRKHASIYVELTTQRALFLGDVASTVKRVTEQAADALDLERVSVWWLDSGQTKITCADLYVRSAKQHSAGLELGAGDFPPYFAALRFARTIAAHDAERDPRTSCFRDAYLRPLGIKSMLDVPIRSNDRMVGVICHEHVGSVRLWTGDDERFAYLMSNFVALALERAESNADPPSTPSTRISRPG
jgi:GAF domain-containing protein